MGDVEASIDELMFFFTSIKLSLQLNDLCYIYISTLLVVFLEK